MATWVMSGVARRLIGGIYAWTTLRTASIRCAQRRLDQLAAGGCRFLICIPYLKSGGAERVAANLTHALAHLYGPESVAVLVTDWSGLIVRLMFPENTPNSYPHGITFTKIVGLSATYDERVWDLMTAVLSMRPEMVLNVNSELMWQVFERFGPELSKHTRLGTVAFGHAYDKGGKPIGYTATHLERLLPYLSFVISDNQSYVDELKNTLIGAPATEKVPTRRDWAAAKTCLEQMDPTKREMGDLAQYLSGQAEPSDAEWAAAKLLAHKITPKLSPADAAKLCCLYQFASQPMTPAVRIRAKRRQILWASRVTRCKFPEILPRIARLLPDCDIHAYGAREFGYRFPATKSLLFPRADLGDRIAKAPNLFWHGSYKNFRALPLERFDAFLYTSLYDGLPNVLLEAGAYRIPIVAPMVGGIGELIDKETGWPVSNAYDPREYADRVREILAAPVEATQRALSLSHLIARRHSFEAFCAAVRNLVGDHVPARVEVLRPVQSSRPSKVREVLKFMATQAGIATYAILLGLGTVFLLGWLLERQPSISNLTSPRMPPSVLAEGDPLGR